VNKQRHASKANIVVATKKWQRSCGRMIAHDTPAELVAYRRETRPLHGAALVLLAVVAIVIVGAAVFAGTGCAWLGDHAGSIASSGAAMQSIGGALQQQPFFPALWPAGALVTVIGAAVAGAGKYLERPKLVTAGIAAAGVGIGGVAGTDVLAPLALDLLRPPAIIRSAEPAEAAYLAGLEPKIKEEVEAAVPTPTATAP
jgi:hypothetical protein